MTDFARLAAATADLEPPYAVVDLDAALANAHDMVRRAGGKPIRLASKSLRCREVMRRVLAIPGYAGVLAFTLSEAIWLADEIDDVVVGYPTADRASLRLLAADERLASRITLMVDSVEQLDLIEAAVGSGGVPLRVCLELDAALRAPRGLVHLGARRSPVHGARQARALAREVVGRPGFRLVGLMAYEGQIAGMGDNAPGSPALRQAAVRAVQRISRAEIAHRRAAVVAAVEDVAKLEFVNGGGTGSLESTAAEEAVSELAAGSGVYMPALFDNYRAFAPSPAAYFVLSVVRRPAAGMVTVLGGGWVASGPIGPDRLPTVAWPEGLSMLKGEGAGEVQTPLVGEYADRLRIGDRVWFRHAKAGELCERVDQLALVSGDGVELVPTYRGEGHAFL